MNVLDILRSTLLDLLYELKDADLPLILGGGVAIEEQLTKISLSGTRTTGEPYTAALYLPSTYSLLMMKLFALRDQVEDEEKEFGRKHALDLYTLVAILTEPEYIQTQALTQRFSEAEEARVAARIVIDLFETIDSQGMLRIRENVALPANADLEEFRTVMVEIFPSDTKKTPASSAPASQN